MSEMASGQPNELAKYDNGRATTDATQVFAYRNPTVLFKTLGLLLLACF